MVSSGMGKEVRGGLCAVPGRAPMVGWQHWSHCLSQRAPARGPRMSLVAQLVTVWSQVGMRLASGEHKAGVARRCFGCIRSGSSPCSPVLFGFISGVSSILIAVCGWGASRRAGIAWGHLDRPVWICPPLAVRSPVPLGMWLLPNLAGGMFVPPGRERGGADPGGSCKGDDPCLQSEAPLAPAGSPRSQTSLGADKRKAPARLGLSGTG